jgi:hypothetical protein
VAERPLPAPVREIGYGTGRGGGAGDGGSWWEWEEEPVPELRWPQSVRVYESMVRSDPQVSSVLRAVTMPIIRTGWRIDPAGARDEVAELIAADLGLPLVGGGGPTARRTRDRFSWAEHLQAALMMLVYGHAYFEQVVRPEGGKLRLRKLAWRPPRTISRVRVAPDGGLIGVDQFAPAGADRPDVHLPVTRLVAYVHDRQGGNWLGSSLLRPAWKHWLLKDRLLRIWLQTSDRNGTGMPLYTAPEGASAEDMAAGQAIAQAWRSGESGGAAVAYGAKMQLLGVEGRLPDIHAAVRYHDEAIARAVLAHFLTLGGQTGSYALGSAFAEFFISSLQGVAQQVADVVNAHVIEDLVDWNFSPDEPAPRLVFDEIGSRLNADAAAVKLLLDAGAVFPDRQLEESLRQKYGLPPKDTPTGGDT